MNKAFVREPEDTGQAHCPRCGSLGTPVEGVTLDSQLRAQARGQVSAPAWFCPYARCEVAYFDGFGRTAAASDLVAPVWPKDATAPLCPCFGLSIDDVEADVAEGSPRRIRELLARSKSPAARCATASPTGRCCIGEVQRYYFKLVSSKSPGT